MEQATARHVLVPKITSKNATHIIVITKLMITLNFVGKSDLFQSMYSICFLWCIYNLVNFN